MLEVIQVTTTGTAGNATGSTTTGLLPKGYLMGIKLDYHASAPATTDVTITEANGLGRTLLTIANSSTDTAYNPQSLVNKNDGTSAAVYWPFYLDSASITVAVAGSDALAPALTIYLSIKKDI